MSSFKNSRAEGFLASIPQASLDSETDLLTMKCKFNFAYFMKQDAGQLFEEWDHHQLYKLLNKLKEYSEHPLTYWMNQRAGSKSGKVLSIYPEYPKRSGFIRPNHIPHQVLWGRFRLESAIRLVGFIVPGTYRDKAHPITGLRFDCNTFFVVFLDANHKFYQTEDK
jgi:hypothetical protein